MSSLQLHGSAKDLLIVGGKAAIHADCCDDCCCNDGRPNTVTAAITGVTDCGKFDGDCTQVNVTRQLTFDPGSTCTWRYNEAAVHNNIRISLFAFGAGNWSARAYVYNSDLSLATCFISNTGGTLTWDDDCDGGAGNNDVGCAGFNIEGGNGSVTLTIP